MFNKFRFFGVVFEEDGTEQLLGATSGCGTTVGAASLENPGALADFVDNIDAHTYFLNFYLYIKGLNFLLLLLYLTKLNRLNLEI